VLEKIRIHNLAVVEDVTLEFGPGLNVLSGSTGAGKSLILGAVNLLLGEKASPAMIRMGEERAEVEGVFKGPAGRSGTIIPTAGPLRVRREIRRAGRSQAFINDEPATARQLREVCAGLIEPHGQNEQFRLKDPDHHVVYLDEFAGNSAELARYREALEELRSAEHLLSAFDQRMAVIKEKRELLRHRIDEIDRAALSPGERESVGSRIRLLENTEKVFESLGGVHESLENEEVGVVTQLSQALRRVGKITGLSEAFEQFSLQLESALIALRDCSDAIRDYLERAEFDPAELQALIERHAYLSELERRYSATIDQIIAQRSQWEKELDEIEFEDEERARRMAALSAARTATGAAASRLRDSRVAAAKQLDRLMTEQLRMLMMPGARFSTRVEIAPAREGGIEVGGKTAEPLAHGADEVRFVVRTNPGESQGPVDEIASTGEISRIALALKTVASMGRAGAVLVFDELDAGVGADLGGMIAEKLLDLSERYQIICITHMPQIAARGQRHLTVAKRNDGERTFVEVRRVSGDERLREIARMLGGEKGSDHRMALASEMLAAAPRRRRNVRP
jgi:DNA repair protein RecN (Recombination protein N)